MLGAGGLLSASSRAVRQQGWLVVPLALAHALTRVVTLVPWLVVVAQVIAAGRAHGADKIGPSLLLGIPDVLTDPGAWLLVLTGVVLMSFGAWLLTTIVQAGVLRILASQVSQRERTDDATFATGAVDSSPLALLTAGLSGFLQFVAVCCALGTFAAGLVFFGQRPGVLAALLMTIATAALCLLVLVIVALKTGFARAVILEEGPITALANGIALTWRRAGAILPVWWLLVVLQLALAMVFASINATVVALGQGDLAVLFAGPRALVIGVALVVASGVELLLIGAYAALVCDDSGRLPEPIHPAEPVFPALPVAEVLPEPPSIT